VASVDVPVQLVGGWYDIFLPWMVEDFLALRRAGRAPQLIIGPWAHTSVGLKRAELREGIAWLRAHLLGDDRLLRPSPVSAYFTGDQTGWRELPDWPPPGAHAMRWHLAAGGRLADTPPGLEESESPSRYRYDPADPTPAVGGPVLLTREPVVDNRALEARADVLSFTSDPLPGPLTAAGPVSAEVFARSSLDHHDVFVRLCDVDTAGVSRNVCDALVRVAPGAFPQDADGVSRVAVELWPTAHRFAAGHRLRVLVSSGAYPRYARNPGTGEPLVSATELHASDQEVFHDAQHPSVVVLSIVD
jgi:putative CocE/NonD family hydrolase